MITAGCDVGSLSAKAVILENGQILASNVIFARPEPEDSARDAMGGGPCLGRPHMAISHAAWARGTAGTPYLCQGRRVGDRLSRQGAQWLLPRVRMVIDIGARMPRPSGSTLRAMSSAMPTTTSAVRNREVPRDHGRGPGRPLEDMGGISLSSGNPVTISNHAWSLQRPRSSRSSTMAGPCRISSPAFTGPWLTGSRRWHAASNSTAR